MSNTIIKWKEPKEVRVARRQAQGWWAVAGWLLIAFYAGFFTYNLWTGKIATAFILGFTCVLMRIFEAVVPSYEISDEGVSYVDGKTRVRLAWDEIKWYHIDPYPDLSQIKTIRFHARGNTWGRNPPPFVFDTREIDEQALLQLVETNLPGKDFNSF